MNSIPRSCRIALTFVVVAILAVPGSAQEPIRLARTPDISPDGTHVAFSYHGDIWIVETIGGNARAITSHPAHDIYPVFSPDGGQLVFSSNRHGSYNLFVVPTQGGKPRRLTFDSASDIPYGWSPDGKSILFASARGTAYPRTNELYTIPVTGGMARRISASDGKEGTFSHDGTKIAYVRGPGDWYRKGYRGSSNDDLWICNADGSNNRRVTSFNGQDSSPMWSQDGQTLYYVSEFFGTPANIVCQPSSAVASATSDAKQEATSVKPRQITFHKDDAVRHARISANGSYIVYECGADLWVVSTKEGSSPRKMAIEAPTDDKVNPERIVQYTNGATAFALTLDEKHAAFTVRGKLFMMPVGPNSKAIQLTDGPSNDHGPAWAPDGSKLIFISDRGGHDDLYLLESNETENPKLCDAKQFKIKKLTDARGAESSVSFTPDGKTVGFLRAGKFWVMSPDGSNQKALITDGQVFDYDWSPDSKWIVYARSDGSDASELFIVPIGGPTTENPARNVTKYATFNGGVTWSADGKRLCFLSDRGSEGSRTAHVIPLQKQAAPGFVEKLPVFGSPTLTFDWEDIHLRAKAALPLPVDEAAISPDGKTIAFRMFQDLYVCKLGDDLKSDQLTRLTSGLQNPHQIQWSRRKDFSGRAMDVIYFLDKSGTIRLARSTGMSNLVLDSKAATPESYVMPFKVKMIVKADEEYQEMFDQSWRFLAEYFYDNKFHGQNWDEVRARYRPLVKNIAMKEDLYSLMYLMMGELNASHLGVYGLGRGPEEQTADLGLIFDDSYRGKGLKIAEILKRGPADRRGIVLKAGEFVVAIDGVEVTESTDLSKLLNGKNDEMVVLQVTSNPASDPRDPKARRKVTIQATSRTNSSELMYERWVEHNAKRVSELSQGKLGYIHIPEMSQPGLDGFIRSLYSDNFDKEAIVVDVRNNGGGYTHDQVLNYLTGREHTMFKERNGGQGWVIRSGDRKWSRPLVMLINNRSYSDAEILPSAFRTMGLGKLVGQPTSGAVIGTVQIPLIDGSIFLVPRVGVYNAKGENLERSGVIPDVTIETHPDQQAKGVDLQLDKAVEVLQADVTVWKKKNAPAVAAVKSEARIIEPMPPMLDVKPMPMSK